MEGGLEVEVFWVNMKYVHCSLFTLIASTALYHWSTRLVHELTITGETMPQFLPAEFLPRSGLHLSKDRDEFRFFLIKQVLRDITVYLANKLQLRLSIAHTV